MESGTVHDLGQWLSIVGGLTALWRLWGYVVSTVELRARIDERTTMLMERVRRLEDKSDGGTI